LLLIVALGLGQQHHHDVDAKGDKVMGFPHDKTTHHFLLYKTGGAIEVVAKDNENRDKIRMHLRHISHMFAAGDFSAPMLIHGNEVPGKNVMTERKAQIAYQFEELPMGGRVKIVTSDKKALAAVHEFLRFQISEHRTGDSGKVR